MTSSAVVLLVGTMFKLCQHAVGKGIDELSQAFEGPPVRPIEGYARTRRFERDPRRTVPETERHPVLISAFSVG